MLDPTMTYSCGVFDQTSDLESAQVRKYELIANSLGIKNGDSILEIGSGWGGFARYINERYEQLNYVGVTISKEQLEFAKNSLSKINNKNNSISFEFEDYRNLKGKFDKVVSIEMIEAVGHNNYPEYFNKIDSLLKKMVSQQSKPLRLLIRDMNKYDQVLTSFKNIFSQAAYSLQSELLQTHVLKMSFIFLKLKISDSTTHKPSRNGMNTSWVIGARLRSWDLMIYLKESGPIT